MTEQKLKLANPNEINILAFGNSLTEGYTDWGMTFHPYGINLKKTLSALAPNLQVNIDVKGQSGDRVLTTLGGVFLTRLAASLPQRKNNPPKYDLVIVLGGTNDLAFKTRDPNGPVEIFEGLTEVYNYVLESGAALVCVTIPERAIDTRSSNLAKVTRGQRVELNGLMAEFVEMHQAEDAGAGKVFLFDLAPLVPFPKDEGEDGDAGDGIWSPDGLHMNAHGYDFFGEKLAELVYDLLGKPTTVST